MGEMGRVHFRRAYEREDIVRASLENTTHHDNFKEMSYHITEWWDWQKTVRRPNPTLCAFFGK